MQIQKSWTLTTDKKPDIEVLKKAFEILKKAGFPQDKLDEAYEDLCECCDTEDSTDETKTPEAAVEVQVSKTSAQPSDMKQEMMGAMKSLIEKLSK